MGTRENFRKTGSKIWESSRYAGVGLEFGICVVVCHYLGGKVDEYWGTGNMGSLVGIVVGFFAGLLSLIRIAQKESTQRKSPVVADSVVVADSIEGNVVEKDHSSN